MNAAESVVEGLPGAVAQAADRIAGHVRVTPAMALETDAFDLSARLTLKLEQLQHAGSFKPRGAFNRILSADSKATAAGVVAASGGNHGAAVAFAAGRLGLRADVFVPATAPQIKIDRLRAYGANVHVGGADYAEAYAASQTLAARTGGLVVHAYDQPETVAGQGTLARELEAQLQGLDTVVVAVGGGGLIAGIAGWLGQRVRVVGVEPVLAPTLTRALAAGTPVDVKVGGIAADSLGARRIGEIAFCAARRGLIERTVLVEDEQIRAAQLALWDSLRVVTEPAGAAALAALTSGAYRPEPGERVALVVCGANTDPASLGRAGT
ncbi:MAG: threonine/serine dehydratase [Ectothiorhodospiraceae bacterium]|nr:threonine/serine dehydratase [Ectothiorhodospiraceae bacterium]